MTSQESRLLSTSGWTRLTTPLEVPRASPSESSASDVSVTARSPGSSERNSVIGAPPCRWGAFAVGGSAGRSSTPSLISRPREVTTPMVPRAVAAATAVTTSCLARAPAAPSGSSLLLRASSPLDDISTKHGSSATSSGTADVTGAPADSSSTVRRGVP